VGSYSVLKTLNYRQTSAQDVAAASIKADQFNVTIVSPPSGPAVTNGLLKLPDNSMQALTNQLGYYVLSGLFDTENALEGSYPSGSYTLRFSQTNQPERVIPMTIPATPANIPRIVNFDEGQAIDATKDFALQWNAFTPQGPGAFIRLIISDQMGNLVFLAPNPCVPRDLDPMATSIVIPANYFSAGSTYEASLQFGFTFYNSTNDVPQMAGYGAVQRNTSFSLKAAGAGNPVTTEPARFTSFQLLPNGNPEFHLSGTAGKNYTIRRAGSLSNPAWTDVGQVTMDGSGTGDFEDSDPALQFPAFYRALGN